MRWFVEVSRVGENSVADEYCVEAKQWQAALQEARKLRGDSGALSKFSIELLDRGYRAVDPSLKLRYLINEAPPDATLTGESAKRNGNKAEPALKQRALESQAPSAYAKSLAPTPFTTSLAPPAASSPPAARSVAPGAARPTSVSPARSTPAEPSRVSQLVVPDDPVPPAPPLPSGLGLVRSVAPAPSVSAPTSLPVPPFELVRQRAEEPRAESPITYREFAYAVGPNTTRSEVEALLEDRYRATLATIEDRPAGKFVQIAVFDHVFKRRPERPPLATFAWKDWRGEPVLAFPGFGEPAMPPQSQVPAAPEPELTSSSAASSIAPKSSFPELPLPPSVVPSVPSVSASASAPAPSSVAPESRPLKPMAPVILTAPPSAPVPTIAQSAPPPRVEAVPVPVPVVEAAPIARAEVAPAVDETPIPIVEALPLSAAEAATVPILEIPISAPEAAPPPAPPTPPAPSFELTFESAPNHAAPIAVAPSNPKSAERASRPRIPSEGRRRAGEDLIGELFEIMHDLHFARDVAEGSEFVLSVLNELLPCEGVLIHVFDINTGHFVVVRAKGPNAVNILLHRMPDQDPFVRAVMRSAHAMSVADAARDTRFVGPHWQALGVQPRRVLCGGVQLGGRYLGLIEVANPQGDAPFHQSELNALDYICGQFAEFLSKKPIVLSADVVLSRS